MQSATATIKRQFDRVTRREAVRLRVGDWRVIMHDGVVLAVLDIGPRGGVYD